MLISFVPLKRPKGFSYSNGRLIIVFTPFIGYHKIMSLSDFIKVKQFEFAISKQRLFSKPKDIEIIINNILKNDLSILQIYGLEKCTTGEAIFRALELGYDFIFDCETSFIDEQTGNTLLHQAVIYDRFSYILEFQNYMNVKNKEGRIPIQYVSSKRTANQFAKCKVKITHDLIYIPKHATVSYFKLKQTCDDFYCFCKRCQPILPFSKQFLGFNMTFNPFKIEKRLNITSPDVLCICGGGVKAIQILSCLIREGVDLTNVKMFKGCSAGAVLICMLLKYNFNYIFILNIFCRFLPILFSDSYNLQKVLNIMFKKRTLKQFSKRILIEIVTTKINREENRIESSVFTNKTCDEKITTILLASCAAPQRFSPVVIKNEYYVDGGVYENNPLNVSFSNMENCNILLFETSTTNIISPILNCMDFEILNRLLSMMALTKDTIGNSTLNEDVKNSILKLNNLCVVKTQPINISTFETNLDKIIWSCNEFYINIIIENHGMRLQPIGDTKLPRVNQ